MNGFIFIFLILLAIFAAVLRADFILTLIYLMLGVYTLGRLWSQRALDSVYAERTFANRAFLGERVPVSLEVKNRGWLPVVWLQLHESLPIELSLHGFFHQVVSLGGKDHLRFDYQLEGRKRGFYHVGPLSLHTGDVFGIGRNLQRSIDVENLTVYPKIIPLTRVRLPSHSPLGTLRSNQPVFEDPSRVFGKREYVAGDSLRRVDWKATATSGRLQVKIYEPSIALDIAIFLNLNSQEYEPRSRLDATEMAIVVAASVANWAIGQRQSVGLACNGIDPLHDDRRPRSILPKRGRGHLMRILDVLARIQSSETYPLVELLRQECVNLPWGTTLILLTPFLDDDLFDELFHARRSGLSVILVPCGPVANFENIRKKAVYFGFPIHQVRDEHDLDIWRQ